MISLHYTYNFLKEFSTTKKIRYLGQFQNSKYQDILSELRKRENGEATNIKELVHENSDFISSLEKEEMQQSLLNLINKSI